MEVDSKSGASGTISTPDLSNALKPRSRAIKDASQARNLVRTLEQSARERNLKNARIMAKYNAEKPYTQSALEAEGLAWKSNFTTQPLPRLIDKVSPRFVKAIDGVKYLTNSALPETYPGAAEKTDIFRREVTKTIRKRPGWSNFISEVAQENALFGFTSVAWLDKYSWFPKHFSQSDFFVPTGTKSLAKSSQVCVLRETFLVHELFSLIEDKDAAKAAGWDIANTVFAINNAIPEDRRSKNSDWERVYEDLHRESNVGMSHESGALTVSVYHLLATEITGKITHYILTDKETQAGKSEEKNLAASKDVLFEREDEFDGMEQALAFFSFQIGNGKLHGSKGIGRQIYAMAAMLDKSRNEVVDRLSLAGKVLIQADPKAIKKFKMNVVGNALLIGNEFVVTDKKFDPAVEPFLELDNFLTQLLDEMAGATTPKVFEGERVTKAQVELFASREEESRDNIIGRFLGQFSDMMTTLQVRLCDPDTNEEDAKQLQELLLKTMSREELDVIAKQPVAETVKDFTELERQQMVLIAQEAKGNPLYNQKELERRKLTALVDDEFANAVLLADEDPTITAEQSRMQMLEMQLLVGQGTAVPVSPRDNHMVHLQVMAPALESAAQEAVTKGEEGIAILQALAAHADAHFQAAEQSGVSKDDLAPVGQFLNQLKTAITKLNELEQQAAAGEVPGGTTPTLPTTPAPPQPV